MNQRAKAEFMKIWTERVRRNYADTVLEWLLHVRVWGPHREKAKPL